MIIVYQPTGVLFLSAGVHVMLKTPSGVRYALYSLASSKPEPGGTMPKDCATFLSQPGSSDIQLYPTGDVRNKSQCYHLLCDLCLLLTEIMVRWLFLLATHIFC